MKIVDMHCDTISEILMRCRAGESVILRKNELQLDLERMRKSNYMLQNFALFVDAGKCRNPLWEEVCELYHVYHEEVQNNFPLVAPVERFGDIELNERGGRMSALLTVEDGGVCEGELSKLEKLYEMGVRMMTLTWNYANELGQPAPNPHAPDAKGGLTETGFEFVRRMEELGMMIDVSHLSDEGFYDVLKHTRKPFVASHSNAREICPHARNLTDDMIYHLGDRGGCIGLNFYTEFLVNHQEPYDGSLAALVRHAQHIVKIGGMEVLGLGSDFDGIPVNEELPGAEGMERLWDALHGAGFSEEQLDAIFYKNVLRVYQEIL